MKKWFKSHTMLGEYLWVFISVHLSAGRDRHKNMNKRAMESEWKEGAFQKFVFHTHLENIKNF